MGNLAVLATRAAAAYGWGTPVINDDLLTGIQAQTISGHRFSALFPFCGHYISHFGI
jgi:hypothetical protein